MKHASRRRINSTEGIILAIALFALSAGLWWGWFGRDTEYDVAPQQERHRNPMKRGKLVAAVSPSAG